MLAAGVSKNEGKLCFRCVGKRDGLGSEDRIHATALAWHHGLVHRGTNDFRNDDS